MTVVDIKTKQPVNPIDTQLEYTRMEIDFARDRELLAQAIFRDELKHYYRFTIGDALHPMLDNDRRCAMCGGRFPKRGTCYAVWMPESLGGECKPMHAHCFLGASDWLPE